MSFKSVPYLTKLSELLKTNDSIRKESIKSTNATISFTVKGKNNEVSNWIFDLKDSGELKEVKGGDLPPAEITITVSDADLKKLILGKSNAQKLFMTGKLKIKGNVMKAANIEKVLKHVGKEKAKL